MSEFRGDIMSDLNKAILSIYDSSIDLECWGTALDACTHAIGSKSITLTYLESRIDGQIQWASSGGSLRTLNPNVIGYYNENLVHHELEGLELLKQMPCRTLLVDTDVWPSPDDELIKRPDYAYLLKHNGTLRRVVARLSDYPSWFNLIAFQFSAEHKSVPPQSVLTMNRLLPHIAKSIELGRSFSLLRERYSAALAALDFVEVGMCISMGNGTFMSKNVEAQRIFSESDGINLDSSQRPVIRSRKSSEQLRESIAIIAQTSNGVDAQTEFTFSIDRPSGRNPYLIEVSPLRDSAQELGESINAALIMIIDPDNSSHINVERLCSAYNFTRAENSVAQKLVEGWTLADIAEERNVSPETVKSQTKSIMQKTNTHKRSELIRLALKLTPPIKDPSDKNTGSPMKLVN